MEGKRAWRGDVGGGRVKMTAAAVGGDVLNEYDVFANLPAQHSRHGMQQHSRLTYLLTACLVQLLRISVSVKRGLRVIYPQNLGQDAQKMKAVRQRTHIISFMTHKFKLPCVRLTR